MRAKKTKTNSVNGSVDTWDRLWTCLEEADGASVAYVYRLDDSGNTQKPYLLRYPAWPALPGILRDEHNGGDFKILIRRGREMIFSGKVSVGVPLSR